MESKKELKVVSAFEYAIMEIAGETDGIRPRTDAEERELQDAKFRSQLENMQIVKPNGDREDIDVDATMDKIRSLNQTK